MAVFSHAEELAKLEDVLFDVLDLTVNAESHVVGFFHPGLAELMEIFVEVGQVGLVEGAFEKEESCLDVLRVF